MRRPERFGQYKLEDLPPIPPNHRERANYKDTQYAPGNYEAIISQRPIAVHALENPTKFDAGLYAFRKILRDVIRGTNAAAAGDGFADWLRELDGKPNSFCCGNVLDIPEAGTLEEEVKNRRKVLRDVVSLLADSESKHGADRAEFVDNGMAAIEQSVAKA
jgi:hypothetical protein